MQGLGVRVRGLGIGEQEYGLERVLDVRGFLSRCHGCRGPLRDLSSGRMRYLPLPHTPPWQKPKEGTLHTHSQPSGA